MDKFERRRQALIRLKEDLGWGAIAKIAAAIGKEPSYVSRMLYPDGKAGRKRIGEDSAELLSRHFPGWLEEAEHSSAVAQPPKLEAIAGKAWPFPSLPEREVRSLSSDDLKRLEGAIALAMAQLKLKVVPVPSALPSKQQDALSSIVRLAEDGAANDPEYIAIPLKKVKIRAGIAGFSLDQTGDGTTGAIYVSRTWLAKKSANPKKVFASRIGGLSMWPRAHEDDIVLIDPMGTDPRDGKVYAFNHEGEFTLKRLKRKLNKWYLHSDNPDRTQYPPIMADERTFMIGRAILLHAEEI